MRNLTFRLLRPDDIECRPATVTSKGVSVLLYKDARCDMNILDETVGQANWSRSHELINGNLFCTVSINVSDDGSAPYWVSKQDVGTESNMEKEKGEASDSFKRACFNWGIGRELYSSPRIWIPANKCRLEADPKRQDRMICKDSFSVGKIEYDDNKKICFLSITNNNRKETVWSMGQPEEVIPESEQYISKDMIATLRSELKRVKKSEDGLLDWLGVPNIEMMTVDKFKLAMDTMGAH